MGLHRREVLRTGAVAIALPFLESLAPANAAAANRAARAKRLVAINVGLGLHAPNIVPTEAGRNYELSPYLNELAELRDQFTFVSGASHPAVGGGHQSGKSFLTAAKHPNSAGFVNTISLDQIAAEQLGRETRFRSLSLSSSGPGLSWSRSGVEIPTEVRPSKIFERLFLEGKAADKAKQIQRLKDGQSVLDLVQERAGEMERRLSGRDKTEAAQYLTAVREAENRLNKAQSWAARPKPKIDAKPPQDENDRTKMIERLEMMYDMMYLALETDSTRFITFFHTGMNAVPKIPGVSTDYHMLSHHAKNEAKIAELTVVETQLMKQLGRFLRKLNDSTDDEQTLLNDTMVLFGSNLGNASSHDTKNMPMLLAGGGFQHGQHLSFNRDNNYELPRLYVSMLQQLGLEVGPLRRLQRSDARPRADDLGPKEKCFPGFLSLLPPRP